jgi:hypothetical protein
VSSWTRWLSVDRDIGVSILRWYSAKDDFKPVRVYQLCLICIAILQTTIYCAQLCLAILPPTIHSDLYDDTKNDYLLYSISQDTTSDYPIYRLSALPPTIQSTVYPLWSVRRYYKELSAVLDCVSRYYHRLSALIVWRFYKRLSAVLYSVSGYYKRLSEVLYSV